MHALGPAADGDPGGLGRLRVSGRKTRAPGPPALQGELCVLDADCGRGTCVAEVCDPFKP